MHQVRNLPPTEEVLLSDRSDPDNPKSPDVWSYTRNIPLANLCALCTIMVKTPRQSIGEWDLAEKAQDMGLDKFSGIKQFRAMTPRIMPTVIRRHWYSLDVLGLAIKNRDSSLLTLTDLGRKVAHTLIECQFDFGSEIPFALQEELARVLVSSRYVRQFWLSFFMSSEVFNLEELRSRCNPILIETVPESVREKFGDFRFDDAKWTDSGIRIYSKNNSALRQLTIAGKRGVSAYNPPFLALTIVAKFEIYDGLRRWTKEIGLTDELPLDQSELTAFEKATLWPGSKVKECYIVKQYWPVTDDAMPQFEREVEDEIRASPTGHRMRIPDLICRICGKERLSRKNVKDLLLKLQRQNSARFYFEGASPGVIEDFDEMQDFYLPIDGIWRTSIILV